RKRKVSQFSVRCSSYVANVQLYCGLRLHHSPWIRSAIKRNQGFNHRSNTAECVLFLHHYIRTGRYYSEHGPDEDWKVQDWDRSC
ncbi:hypothetical protein PENTCL1PPCAC_19049, partial [Pristionchus entomophagus]